MIPTHNRRDRVQRCIDAVLADPTAIEVVVVVDGSTDGTIERLVERAATDIRLRPVLVEHGGLYPTLQAGAERATGEVVLVVDDDVVPAPGLATGHARHHATQRGIVVLGYMPVATPTPRRRGQFATFLYARNYEWTTDLWTREPTSMLRRFWGGNYSLRREDALRVGFVAPTGRLPYNDDQEFGLRLSRAGITGVFDRTLLAHHEHARDMDAFFDEARRRGIGAMMVHAAHEDIVGPLRLERYEVALPAPARWAVRAGRNRVMARVELALLRPLIHVAGIVRWWKLESLAATVAMHIIEVRTIIEARSAADRGA